MQWRGDGDSDSMGGDDEGVDTSCTNLDRGLIRCAFLGGQCSLPEQFKSPAGDGGSTKMWKTLLPKHEGVGNAGVTRSGCHGGSVALPGPLFVTPVADELPWGWSVLPRCFLRGCS
jgi:hypothetical protein